jgi:hypothetical protein
MSFVRTIVIALATCSIAPPAAASADSLPATDTSNATQSGAAAKAYSIRPQTHEKLPIPDDDAPTTIEVVRPERTIVRDVDEALPLILSGTALLLALTGVGLTLLRTRVAPRPGRSQ